MNNFQIIESPQNQKIKHAVKLRKSSTRKETGQTIVEGFREISRATESGWKFNELYFCPELYLNGSEEHLVSEIHKTGTTVFQCSTTAFQKISYRKGPDGLLAISPLVGKTLSELRLPENPLVLIAETIEKPGNLGTILRAADGAGADAVVVCDPNTDLNNPNVIRASVGTLFYLPIATAPAEETFQWLRKNNIQLLAATPNTKLRYTDVDMCRGTAIAVGAEDTGLSEKWMDFADVKIKIPMLGKNDSLNVSNSAAILLYEAVRQRQEKI